MATTWTSCIVFHIAIQFSHQCLPGWRRSELDSTKCYLLSVSKKSWFEADAFCAASALNAHLTSISSLSEQDYINAMTTDTSSISLCDQIWIGANDCNQYGRFVWVDSKPFSYNNWDQGQPDLNTRCVSALTRTTGKWKTESCGNENCFICENFIELATTSTLLPLTTAQSFMTDCYDWKFIGDATTDGIYRISPNGTASFNVFCDMHTNDGGFTLIQRRQNNQTIFWNRLWMEYVSGFSGGPDEQNFWLGLDRIHILTTKDTNVTLRIDVWGNRCNNTDYNCGAEFDPNGYWYGEWDFQIEDAAHDYRLHISTANAGNLSKLHSNDLFWRRNNGQLFQTVDHDFTSENCTYRAFSGAWWHPNACSVYNLNGRYELTDDQPFDWGYEGFSIRREINGVFYYINPVRTEMKIRRTIDII